MRTLISTAETDSVVDFNRWRDIVTSRIVPIELTPLGDQPFAGALKVGDVGSLLITSIVQTAMRTEATPQTIRRHDKHESLSVAMVLDGTIFSLQGDREAVQRPGEIVLLDRVPTVLTTKGLSRSLILEVPRDWVERQLGPARVYSNLTAGAAQPSTQLAIHFFRKLIQVQELLDSRTATRMSAIASDLLLASIAERLSQELPKALHHTVIVEKAKAYIEAHLSDPALDPPHLAVAMGVSLRQLQMLFREHGRHISDWIWQRRLETAAMRLGELGAGRSQIGIIAFECGFSSQAHFSRRFKDWFGMTPKDYRQAALITAMRA